MSRIFAISDDSVSVATTFIARLLSTNQSPPQQSTAGMAVSQSEMELTAVPEIEDKACSALALDHNRISSLQGLESLVPAFPS